MSTTSTPPRADITVPVIEGVVPNVSYMFSRTAPVLRLEGRVAESRLVEHHYAEGENGSERESWILSLYWTVDGVRYVASGPRTYAPTLQREGQA
jgi:hypothetical protein